MSLRQATGGFSGAIVVDVQTAVGRYALRGWPEGEFPPERIRELHRFLRHLQTSGLPAVVPLPVAGSRDTLLWAQLRWWQLEPWLPGTPTGEISDAQLRSAMRTLGRLHIAAARYEPAPEGADWFAVGRGPAPAIRARRGIIAAWSPQRVLDARQRTADAPRALQSKLQQVLDGFVRWSVRVDEELAACEALFVPLHPCLRDVWSAHVLFTGDDVTGLIDPGAARTDHVAADLTRLLGSLLADDRVRWGRALDWYQELRPLSDDELRLLRALDRSSVLLSGMTWVERFLNEEIPAARVPEISERLSAIARRVGNLGA